MQLKSFQYVITVSETPTLSAAAEKLYISQPALSQQLRKIEEEFGTPLFDRRGHSFVLTPAGTAFVSCGRRILQAYDTMNREVRLMNSASKQVLNIGISPFYSRYYLPAVLPEFIQEHPEVRVDVDEDISANLERKLLEGKLDFCAIPLKPKNERLAYEVFCREQIYIAVPRNHPINRHYPADAMETHAFPSIDLALLRNESFIGLKKIQKFNSLGMRLCREAGFEPNTICETMNWETVHMMISTGLGVGFVPEMLVGTIPDKDLCPCYYQLQPAVFRDYAIAERQGTVPSPAAELFKQRLRERFSGLSFR